MNRGMAYNQRFQANDGINELLLQRGQDLLGLLESQTLVQLEDLSRIVCEAHCESLKPQSRTYLLLQHIFLVFIVAALTLLQPGQTLLLLLNLTVV